MNCEKLLKTPSIVIRELDEIIEKLIACEPACEHAMLLTKRLEIQRNFELKHNFGNYDKKCILKLSSIIDIQWWYNTIDKCSKPNKRSNLSIALLSDSSPYGWDGVYEHLTAGGIRSKVEQNYHINYLELNAAYLML